MEEDNIQEPNYHNDVVVEYVKSPSLESANLFQEINNWDHEEVDEDKLKRNSEASQCGFHNIQVEDWESASSSVDTDSEPDNNELLKTDLAEWAVDGNIALTSVTKLLGILRKHKLEVPAQAVTLLQTPRTINIIEKSGV